jgi:site-specific recombinase XerD
MSDNFLPVRGAIDRLRGGLFSSHLDSFVAALRQLGYARVTVRGQLQVLDALDQWLKRRSLVLVDLHEAVINRFLEERRASGRRRYGDAQTVRQLLRHLRATGVVRSPEPATDHSPLATLGRQYANYLEKERGLAAVTIYRYWQFARRFLSERFGDAPIVVCDLAPDDISRFLLRHARAGSPDRSKTMVAALRSFFRFLFLHGKTEGDLAGAVPTVPQRRLAELPKYLSPEEVERVIRTCERDSPGAARNRAILLLLARLGLRANEVITLELEDVDWRAGVLKVRSKGGQHDCLPLPADVGQAMADYLRHHRPPCTTRRFFVLAKAPYQGFAHSTSLSTIVRRAITRAGLHANNKGAHVLRHSLATGMLRSGASLDEISEILRHRVAPTTAIYAKVDVQGLRSLALPWPRKEGE